MPTKDEIDRQCALTREVKPTADLIRFVVSPDGELVPDTEARAEGRGVWISLGRNAVTEAVRKKVFEKSLKQKVTLPEDLPGLTAKRLQKRYVSSLQMAKKAGQLLTGAQRVRDAIATGEVIALITATDAAEDGRQKLLSALRGHRLLAAEAGLTAPETAHLELLDSSQLGLALGLENVIHAALVNGAAARSALAKGLRLTSYLSH